MRKLFQRKLVLVVAVLFALLIGWQGYKYYVSLKVQNNALEVASLCDEVLRLYKSGELKRVTLTEQNTEVQHIDIDNDGVDEVIEYHMGRADLTMIVLYGDGEKMGFSIERPTAYFEKTDVVRIRNKNYLVHNDVDGPYELAEIVKNSTFAGDQPWRSKMLCGY